MSVGHDPEAMKKVLNRLKRAEGQLHALVASIGPEANCRDVVTQLAAVSKALDKAGFAIIANAMVSCALDDVEGEGNHDGMTQDEIEKLFLSLA
jgi:DNA-binding FrmR family transcriptional regulator